MKKLFFWSIFNCGDLSPPDPIQNTRSYKKASLALQKVLAATIRHSTFKTIIFPLSYHVKHIVLINLQMNQFLRRTSNPFLHQNEGSQKIVRMTSFCVTNFPNLILRNEMVTHSSKLCPSTPEVLTKCAIFHLRNLKSKFALFLKNEKKIFFPKNLVCGILDYTP